MEKKNSQGTCYVSKHLVSLVIIYMYFFISVIALSKVWFCGRSLEGIAGSNPAGGMDVCLL